MTDLKFDHAIEGITAAPNLLDAARAVRVRDKSRDWARRRYRVDGQALVRMLQRVDYLKGIKA